MAQLPLDDLPGFRRRVIVTPSPHRVKSEVEDDYHCMSVTLRHDGHVATGVEPVLSRAPWTTCPGAVAQLERSFAGVALDAFATRGEKPLNCTHLHDLAVLAAAHAHDDAPLVYDILVSDPVEGRCDAEIRRNGTAMMRWTLAGLDVAAPADIADTNLFKLGPWIDTLDADRQEAARLLRWGALLANGRAIPLARQSDASRMPPNCYTFQPDMAVKAKRVGVIRDFSKGGAQPLGGRVAAMVELDRTDMDGKDSSVVPEDRRRRTACK